MSHPELFTQYAAYSTEDFIRDPFYQESIINRSEERERFWAAFLAAYPQQKEALDRAAVFLNRLSFRDDHPSAELVEQCLRQHLAQVAAAEEQKVIRLHRRSQFLRYAAMIGGVVLLLALLLTRDNPKVVAKTAYGTLQTVLLPDSSTVVLNANSTLEYAKRWKSNNPREVWLHGEAFFDVKHVNRNPALVRPSERFLLHTKSLVITVLGTSFNVRQRRQKTEVVLQSGKINIHFLDGKQADILMQPGDVVQYDGVRQRVFRTTTNPENYTSWKERKLLLLNPTVQEIVQYLEDNFGKKIVLLSPGLGEKKIEGPILLSNLDDALFILSTVLKANVTESDSTYYLTERPPSHKR